MARVAPRTGVPTEHSVSHVDVSFSILRAE